MDATDEFKLSVSFKGKVVALDVSPSTTIELVRLWLFEATQVAPERQKLTVVGGGKPSNDEATLAELKWSHKTKVQLIGTPEEAVFVFDEAALDAGVVDDELEAEMLELHQLPENVKKLQLRVDKIEVEELSPQVHNRLLVLDVDYTLYDHRTPNENIAPLTRPFLHEFLTEANKHYDIVIWSATSMKWVFLKCKEMGLLENPNFKLRFLLCESSMFNVESMLHGKMRVCRVKPLEFIWRRFPNYTPEATIMFDDVRHNFLCNPKNGLVIRPFRNGPSNRDDIELQRLARFLTHIKDHHDVRTIDLKRWERLLE